MDDELECYICEADENRPDTVVLECNCGMTICKKCLATYGDICPGCGK
jgi:hypothetical protein